MKALFFESLPYQSVFKVGSHHYAERFAADGWEVLWVSHPISPLHLLSRVKRDMEVRLEGWRHGPLRTGPVSYYSPMTLLPTAAAPLLRTRTVAQWSARVTVPGLRGVLTRAGFGSPDVVWLTHPVFQPLASTMPAGCRTVRVADETGAFRAVSPALGELETEAIGEADVVFAVSRAVFDRTSGSRGNIVRLPNGVDAARFGRPVPEPPEFSAIPRPRVLYVGAVEYWFDIEAFDRCARENPEAAFVVVGPDPHGVFARPALPSNVRFLGPRPYDEIAAYMRACDVGLVPFRRDEMVDAIHPIKVYEYLAVGLRVVATRWTELEEMGAPVDLADATGLPSAVKTALAGVEAGRAERLAYASANTWDARYDVVKRHVADCLGGS